MKLDRAGITDPHMRLLMSDPATRPEVLKVTLQARLKQVDDESVRTNAIFDIKTQQISNYIKDRMTDQTTPQELREMFQLLDESTASTSTRNRFEVLNAPARLISPPAGVPALPTRVNARFQVVNAESTMSEQAAPLYSPPTSSEASSTAPPSERSKRFQAAAPPIGTAANKAK